MRPFRFRLSVLTFDKRDRLVYWPDAVLSVDRQGKFDAVRRLTFAGFGGAPGPGLERLQDLTVHGVSGIAPLCGRGE